MKIQSIFSRSDENNAICLGRFDGLHKGHQKVISAAREFKNLQLCIFTLKRSEAGCSLLSFEELKNKAESIGVEKIIFADQTQEFFNIEYDKFLDLLYENCAPRAIIAGEDFSFGKDRRGGICELVNFCSDKGIDCRIVSLEKFNGKKISSTLIKECLKSGETEQANELLGGCYFAIGKVVHGNGVGRKLGFPTANILTDITKFAIKQGVYSSSITIDGKTYKSVTSYGNAPTFGNAKLTLETHIPHFCEEIYGKNVKVELKKYLRENIRFGSEKELINQLKKDITQI